MSKPNLPDDEPTEAAVCRMILRRIESDARSAATRISRSRARMRLETEAVALRACMRAAGWRTDELAED